MITEVMVAMENHPTLSFLLVAGLLIFMTGLFRTIGFYAWYVVVILLAWGGAFLAGNFLYFWVFVLGMATAFAEIIGKFSDEPMKSLRTPHAVSYHLLNGSIACLALMVLILYGTPASDPLDQLKIVVAAGFGSMLVMRSKLFNIKVDGEDVSVGPDQIIKVFFRFMDQAIDRIRAQSRIVFVKEKMDNLDFSKIYDYGLTMLRAAQVLEVQRKGEIEKEIEEIKTGDPADPQLKSYRLGFLLLNEMGEDFVAKLFDGAPAEWKIRAPAPAAQGKGLMNVWNPFKGSREEKVYYFAYGSSLSTQKLLERLKWSGLDPMKFEELVAPKKGLLRGFRLVFNKPGDTAGEGWANLAEEEGERVEGVVYHLEKEALAFLDRMMGEGYRRRRATVTVGSKEIEAQVYTAVSTQEGLKPKKEYLDLLIKGAEEHQLGPEYIDMLKSVGTLPVEQTSPVRKLEAVGSS